MRNLILLLLFACIHLFNFSQPNTEIFLFDLNTENGKFELSNFKNISNNEGYDNQPSFLDGNNILFASTRNGQTDIAKYSINYDSKIYINLSEGSEYSPLKIPNQIAVSAIRLDKDGKQLLYSYSLRNGESSVLIDDLVIGYHVWLNDNTVLSSVLDGKKLSLYSSNINTKTNRKLEEKIGRSLHKIPNSNLISFVSKKDSLKWKIKSINPISGVTKHLKITLPKVEDYCWLPNGTLLMGKDDKLYIYKPKRDSNWNEIASLSDFGIKNISRLAISPDGTKIAIVGEGGKTLTEVENEVETESETEVEKIVQQQLDAYNKRDIDAFMATYSTDVKLYDYPEKLKSEGQKTMRESYEAFFKRTPDLQAFIKKRIVIGNKVIDEEQVTINGKIYNAVAIYEVKNGLISKVTFIQ
jgi:hypothetical protein